MSEKNTAAVATVSYNPDLMTITGKADLESLLQGYGKVQPAANAFILKVDLESETEFERGIEYECLRGEINQELSASYGGMTAVSCEFEPGLS